MKSLFISNIFKFFVLWHRQYLGGSLRIIESTSEKITGSITVEIIESIMLYDFCLSILGVDLPSVCLSV